MNYQVDLAFIASQVMAEIVADTTFSSLVTGGIHDYTLVESFVPDKQKHNHIALTYKIVADDGEFYVRFTVALRNNTWCMPSSVYFYTNIQQNLGYKLSFRDDYKSYKPEFSDFGKCWAVCDYDMYVQAVDVLIYNIVNELKRIITNETAIII